MYGTVAFQSLGPFEVRILLELYMLFNGNNNGYLYLSLREAARRCRMGKDKAGDCFRILQERGFIRSRADEPVNYVVREARCWILTEFEFAGREATKDFMKWRPENQNERPEKRTRRPVTRTKSDDARNSADDLSLKTDKNVLYFRSAVPD